MIHLCFHLRKVLSFYSDNVKKKSQINILNSYFTTTWFIALIERAQGYKVITVLQGLFWKVRACMRFFQKKGKKGQKMLLKGKKGENI